MGPQCIAAMMFCHNVKRNELEKMPSNLISRALFGTWLVNYYEQNQHLLGTSVMGFNDT